MVMEIEQQSSTEEVNPQPKKRGVFGRLKSKRKSNKQTKAEEKRESSSSSPAPSDTASEDEGLFYSREGVPILTSTAMKSFRPSDARPVMKHKNEMRGHRGASQVGYRAPSARESAFKGPPRYDWIDIETAAAIKVQAAYRRNKVMWELEKQGKSTAQMRNRIRKRQVKNRLALAEDTPSLFQCCGVGLLFGDATEEDADVVRQLERQHYEAKKKERDVKESQLRSFKMRKKPDLKLNEGVEVVETFDEEEEDGAREV